MYLNDNEHNGHDEARDGSSQDDQYSLEIPRPRQSGDEPIWDMVRRVRKSRGLTQYQLADVLVDLSHNHSVSRDEVARWERGKRTPGPYWRSWLSVALGVSSEELAAATRHARRLRP